MINLAEAKLHLRVDHLEEDAAIQQMMEAAEVSVMDYLNLDTLPEAPPVAAAMLMLIGALYENRESVTDKPVSESVLFTRLLAPYRNIGI